MRFFEVADIIPFPTSKKTPVKSRISQPQRYGDDGNRLAFIRISNGTREMPGQRTLDILWAATLVRLPPLIVRAINNLQPGGPALRFNDMYAEKERVITAKRDADDILFFEISFENNEHSKYVSSLPFMIFHKKALLLLLQPKSIK